VSDFQRGVLALRQREILAGRRQQAAVPSGVEPALQPDPAAAPADAAAPAPQRQSRDEIARRARLSSNQVVLIEKIQKQARPEVVAAVKSGAISINAAAAVASLPEQEQLVAALGGREELQQAARRVRDIRKKVRSEEALAQEPDSVDALKARIRVLEAENAGLRAQLAARPG
jgi:hypothetical protein